MKTKFAHKNRVALKEDPSCRGFVYEVFPPYNPNNGDVLLYQVQWDKAGEYLYIEEALISEAEAIKLTVVKA
jgi:hypothetical protein